MQLTTGVAGFCIASFLKFQSGNDMRKPTGFVLYSKSKPEVLKSTLLHSGTLRILQRHILKSVKNFAVAKSELALTRYRRNFKTVRKLVVTNTLMMMMMIFIHQLVKTKYLTDLYVLEKAVLI